MSPMSNPMKSILIFLLLSCISGMFVFTRIYANVPIGYFFQRNPNKEVYFQHCNGTKLDISVCANDSMPDLNAMCNSTYRDIPIQAVFEEKFTLLIMTHSRWFLLHKLLSQYTKLESLGRVVILWYNPEIDPPKNLTNVRKNNGKEVLIHRLIHGEIYLRFQAFPEINTQAVLSLDDDKLIANVDIEHAFQVWKKHSYAIVGWDARAYTTKKDVRTYQIRSDQISMILTSSAFFHRDYLRMFDETLPQEMKKIIGKKKNCEDIAMNMVVSRHCNCVAGIHIKTKHRVSNISPSGPKYNLYARPSHHADRSLCLNMFKKYYGDYPLQSTKCSF